MVLVYCSYLVVSNLTVKSNVYQLFYLTQYAKRTVFSVNQIQTESN